MINFPSLRKLDEQEARTMFRGRRGQEDVRGDYESPHDKRDGVGEQEVNPRTSPFELTNFWITARVYDAGDGDAMGVVEFSGNPLTKEDVDSPDFESNLRSEIDRYISSGQEPLVVTSVHQVAKDEYEELDVDVSQDNISLFLDDLIEEMMSNPEALYGTEYYEWPEMDYENLAEDLGLYREGSRGE